MHSWRDGSPRSNRVIGIDLEGDGTIASLEGGYPFWLGQGLLLEPQAQIIWQRMHFNLTWDLFSPIGFDADDAVTGRIGAHLQGTFAVGTTTVRPYLKANFWRNFDTTDRTSFGSAVLPASSGATSLEVGGGIVATVSPKINLFAVADYTTNLNGPHRETLEGNLGILVIW
jgi:autotransporter family porin